MRGLRINDTITAIVPHDLDNAECFLIGLFVPHFLIDLQRGGERRFFISMLDGPCVPNFKQMGSMALCVGNIIINCSLNIVYN